MGRKVLQHPARGWGYESGYGGLDIDADLRCRWRPGSHADGFPHEQRTCRKHH